MQPYEEGIRRFARGLIDVNAGSRQHLLHDILPDRKE